MQVHILHNADFHQEFDTLDKAFGSSFKGIYDG
jgi:hypothetical protein